LSAIWPARGRRRSTSGPSARSPVSTGRDGDGIYDLLESSIPLEGFSDVAAVVSGPLEDLPFAGVAGCTLDMAQIWSPPEGTRIDLPSWAEDLDGDAFADVVLADPDGIWVVLEASL